MQSGNLTNQSQKNKSPQKPPTVNKNQTPPAKPKAQTPSKSVKSFQVNEKNIANVKNVQFEVKNGPTLNNHTESTAPEIKTNYETQNYYKAMAARARPKVTTTGAVIDIDSDWLGGGENYQVEKINPKFFESQTSVPNINDEDGYRGYNSGFGVLNGGRKSEEKPKAKIHSPQRKEQEYRPVYQPKPDNLNINYTKDPSPYADYQEMTFDDTEEVQVITESRLSDADEIQIVRDYSESDDGPPRGGYQEIRMSMDLDADSPHYKPSYKHNLQDYTPKSYQPPTPTHPSDLNQTDSDCEIEIIDDSNGYGYGYAHRNPPLQSPSPKPKFPQSNPHSTPNSKGVRFLGNPKTPHQNGNLVNE
jgi:hypothetical protein